MSRIATAALLALAALVSFSGVANAAGDPQAGASLANACMGCHGIDGYRNAYPSFRVPKLAGQKPDYIIAALKAYKDKTRPHPTMRAQAASLSDQDMQDIAAFIAAEGEAVTGAAANVPGKEKVAVCAACHGDAGISPSPIWPSLAGQHRDYLEHSINEYRTKRRQDPIMQGQVTTLTDADVREIAAFFAAQPGLFTTHLKN